MKETDKILNEIKHYRRQLSINHENALKRLNYFSKYIMDENVGQSIYYLDRYKECIDKNNEFVKMIAKLSSNYYQEASKEMG